MPPMMCQGGTMRTVSANVLLSKRNTSVITPAAGDLEPERRAVFQNIMENANDNASEKEEARRERQPICKVKI